MRSLSELVLTEGQTVSAVGWLDGPANDRVLCVSPSWRDDRRVRVQGGFVPISPPAAEADALNGEHQRFVRVQGTWREGSVSDARVVDQLETNQPATPRSAAVVITPAPQEQKVLTALLKAGVISWYRTVRQGDGARTLRVGTSDLIAAEDALVAHGLEGAQLIELPWTDEDVDTARAHLQSQGQHWHVSAYGGGGVAADADLPGFSAEVLYVEPGFAAWADALPPGLLEATVLIKPAN